MDNHFENGPFGDRQKRKDLGDSIFEQATRITKAHGYDILAEQVKELDEKNKALAQALSRLVHTLETDDHRQLPDLIKESKTALKKNYEIRKF